MSEILKRIGENVRTFRTYKKLSRRALGEQVGLSGQSIWNIETGRTDPKLATLSRLAAALDTTLPALVSEVRLYHEGEVPSERMAYFRRMLEQMERAHE